METQDAAKSRRPSDIGPGAGVRDAGSTLIELLVVIVLLPVVVGAVVLAFNTFLLLHNSVSNRILDAADEQVVSSNFETDVHSATQITTSTTAACGTGTQILGLRWNLDSQGGYQTTVSYVKSQQGSTHSLVRNYCVNGSSTASTTNAVAVDVPSNLGPPAIVPQGASIAAAAGFTSTQSVTSVTLPVTAPASNHTYTLVAVPATNATNTSGGTTVTPNTTCGFASPGTGTYASTLCFVDFTGLQSNGAPTSYCSGSGQSEIDAGVLNTPFTLKFCVSTTGTATVAPHGIPTYPYTDYGNGDTSEAFLGNNGFYADIPGQPALYQSSQGGNTFVYLSKIQVLDASGSPASGWSLVTGDAESTDGQEGMIYTTCPSVANPGRDSNNELNWSPGYSACAASSQAPAFTLLPNSSSSAFGNSCHAPYYPSNAGWDNFRFSGAAHADVFTGVVSGTNTNTVQCFGTIDSDKTGTVMLAAPTPANITVFMQGAGLEAMFVGLQLP